METFAESWLTLRVDADAAARVVDLARRFRAALPDRPRVMDLACGTGGNARYLERCGAVADWVLVDGDSVLLATAGGLAGAVDRRHADLTVPPARDFYRDIDGITASAFFDLVSADWFAGFAAQLPAVPLLFALTIDGRRRFVPTDADDATILAAYAADQARDKGFGPALAGAAPEHMVKVLELHDFSVTVADSAWRLTAARDGALMAEMVASMAAVTGADDWADRRRAALAAGRLALEVGHCDILALPPPAATI